MTTPWPRLHSLFFLGGLVVTVFAVLFAEMYLLQSRRLKLKRPAAFFARLPSLEVLDRWHFRFLMGGGILLSLGILNGTLEAARRHRADELLKDLKVALSLFTVFFYWGILIVRMTALGRGQKIAIGTLLIFLLFLATWMSSLYAPSGFHKGF